MSDFQGASQINLDEKGRLAIPVKHRDGLAAPSKGKLTMTAHPHGCLLLYPLAEWEPKREQLNRFPSMNREAATWKRLLMGFADPCAMDNAGRVLISPELRNFAGIEKQIMFVGQGSHFEMWSYAAWQEQLKSITSGSAGLPPGTEDFYL